MNKIPQKTRIYSEDVKTKHTTHWDWDYLTQAQLEEMIRSNQSQHRFRLPFRFGLKASVSRRIAIIAAAGVCAVALAAVIIHTIG
jgi:hypothetical protein